MERESLKASGVVISSENGYADVEIVTGCKGHSHSTKIFCSGNCATKSVVRVKDNIGAQCGQMVQICVGGDRLMKATILLYGIPLILIVAGIVLGMSIFSGAGQPELMAFITGMVITGLYYLGLNIYSRKGMLNASIPEIVS